MKDSGLTVTDQFCGAGGSSQGVRNVGNRIGGVEVKMAMNHWKLAIETHNTNFPETLHDCTDLSACDPRRYPSTNILITSPECTNHSLAKGQKAVKATMDLFNAGTIDPAAERSRATMWDVPRFAEYHKYEVVVVENVVDARKWVMWDAWLKAMHLLGYDHRCLYLNSMHHHPTPQSRDRMYVVFWKKGNKAPMLDFTPIAYCPCCQKDVRAIQSWKNPQKPYGKYRQQYVYVCPVDATIVEPYYHAAFNCIDWSDIGIKISDRKNGVSENTRARIQHGLDKYGVDPVIITANYGSGLDCRVRSLDKEFWTQTARPTYAVSFPLVLKTEHAKANPGNYIRKSNDPLFTQTTADSMGFVVPWIMEMNRTGECKPASESTSTITAGGTNHAVVSSPFIITNKGQSKSHDIKGPTTTVTSKPCHGLITTDSFKSFISSYYGQNTGNAITEAIGTQTTKDRHALVSYQKPTVDDCYYRMLKPHEIQRAMAFDDDYIVLGNSKEKVKQCGNAVTPPVMEWIIEQCVKSLM